MIDPKGIKARDARHGQTSTTTPSSDQTKQTLGVYDRLAAFERALTVREVAALFNLKQATIYKLAAENLIPCRRIRTSVRFDPKEIAEWWKRNT